MTTLFRKITNKMIANCRNYVMEGADRSAALWEQPMMGVVARLQACLALNEGYQEQYFMTRDKLLTQPKGKQFDFNENAIFGAPAGFARSRSPRARSQRTATLHPRALRANVQASSSCSRGASRS